MGFKRNFVDSNYSFFRDLNFEIEWGYMSCIFCQKEKIVTDIIYEDALVMAFMDIASCKMVENLTM